MSVGEWFTYVQRGNRELARAQVDHVESTNPKGAFTTHCGRLAVIALWFYPADENIHWTCDESFEGLRALLAASTLADTA